MIEFWRISKEAGEGSRGSEQGKGPAIPGEEISFSQAEDPGAGRSLDTEGEFTPEEGYQYQYDERLSLVKDLYQQGLSLADKVITSKEGLPDIDMEDVFVIVEKFINFLDTQELVGLVFSKEQPQAHYLSYNSVNVCILALEAGRRMGFERDMLVKLGGASFLHDVGMRAYLDIADRPKRLSMSDYQKIKQHPREGRRLLESAIAGIESCITAAVEQEHERVDGSGYPYGIKANKIDEFAQLIGFADVYEALTHPRPYRPAFVCIDALGLILRNKRSFDPRIVKSFLEKIGLYPRGTIVELNTKEKAYVLRQNSGSPSCPTVGVVIDPEGRRVEKLKEIDLSKTSAVYIVTGKQLT